MGGHSNFLASVPPVVSDLERLPPEEEGRANVVHVQQERAAHELEGIGDPEQDHTA